jgi:hypothetical protein
MTTIKLHLTTGKTIQKQICEIDDECVKMKMNDFGIWIFEATKGRKFESFYPMTSIVKMTREQEV